MKMLDVITAALVAVGGLNWGLVGFFQFDLVAAVFGGPDAVLARVIYALVGLSAIYLVTTRKALERRWAPVTVRA
jgi:uncharacterized membrane protein YuzA (DUF378 family)